MTSPTVFDPALSEFGAIEPSTDLDHPNSLDNVSIDTVREWHIVFIASFGYFYREWL
jgi:hypothetical protein